MEKGWHLFRHCCFVLAMGGASYAGEADYPPGTFQLTPEIDLRLQPVQVVVPEQFAGIPRNLTLNLPPGFTARVFAAGELLKPESDLIKPRFMAFSPEGVLHVANMGWFSRASKRSQIVAFPDLDKDGVADRGTVVADTLTKAHSLAFYKGDLYVADTQQVVQFKDGDKDGVYEERHVFIDDIPTVGQHETRTIVFDELGGKIYLGVGRPCDLCRDEDPERGAILQFDLDGSHRRVFARGIRNAVGLALHPITHQLWGTHNGHDQEGPNLPPEWIDILRDGGFYGVPFAYGYQVYVDFSRSDYKQILPLSRADSLLVQSMQRPVALVPAHLAPMGILFYTYDLFPPEYHNSAFIALRAGRLEGKLAAARGFKVVALFSEPDGTNARIADFITGFEHGTKEEDFWGTPVGLATDSEGNLYLSLDEITHAILRIEHSSISASWEHNLPDTLVQGEVLKIEATVHLDRLAPGGSTPEVRADLSTLGGPEIVPLAEVADSLYALETSLVVGVPNGVKSLSIEIEQATPQGTRRTRLVETMVVVPREDLVVFGDKLGEGWSVTHSDRLTADLEAGEVIYQGKAAGAYQVKEQELGVWNVKFLPPSPVEPAGYSALRFAFHPGTVDASTGQEFSVRLGNAVKLLGRERRGVELSARDWQVVEVPLAEFQLTQRIEEIRFVGTLVGKFYLDDIRLVAVRPSTATAVLVEFTPVSPQGFSLEQNYPNPFNHGTIIRFFLPQPEKMALVIYSLSGQKIATIAAGHLDAGAYTVPWDGRDTQGREMASGVYLYRLQAGTQLETRKLLLLR